MSGKNYPDNSGIHDRKARGRRARAGMSFGEKLDALDALKARVEPIVRAREARNRAKTRERADVQEEG